MTHGITPAGSGHLPPAQQSLTSQPFSDAQDKSSQQDHITTGSGGGGLPPEVRDMFDSGALNDKTLEDIQSILDHFSKL